MASKFRTTSESSSGRVSNCVESDARTPAHGGQAAHSQLRNLSRAARCARNLLRTSQHGNHGLGRGRGVGRDLGVALGVAVPLGVGVTVAVAVAVAVGVGVIVGVGGGVEVGVAVAVAVGVGVTVGVTVGVVSDCAGA